MVQRMAIWVARHFGVDIDGLFWDLLYRELIRTELSLNRDGNFAEVFKNIGSEASIGSAKRHTTVIKLFAPKSATDILGYIEIIWATVFGVDLEMSEDLITEEEGNVTRTILKVAHCPICQGFGDDKEDFQELLKETLGQKGEGYACILVGMIEGLSNYLFELREEPYKVKIVEKECIALGGDQMVFEAILTKLDS